MSDNSGAIDGGVRLKRRAAGGHATNDLTEDVRDLLGRIAHVADPEIARLRIKIDDALSTAKRAVADGTDQVQRQIKDTLHASDQYVRDRPWQSVGIAAAAGIIVGFLIGKR
ncbi:MAG TPA: hypothetical protein VMV25_05355 [Steroidobacteraceae bacterium]|nr:hypothetical protein [Steroidobacteraceae bacterium]